MQVDRPTSHLDQGQDYFAIAVSSAVDGEDGPVPEEGPYAGHTLLKELSDDPSRHWP